jgi:hypothetical protein
LWSCPFLTRFTTRNTSFPTDFPKYTSTTGKAPQGFGLIYQGRLVCYYNFETDLGDGWDDVHGDSQEIRNKALQMGANIVQYVLVSKSLFRNLFAESKTAHFPPFFTFFSYVAPAMRLQKRKN